MAKLTLSKSALQDQRRKLASYNRFRDFREPFSEDFPTIEIGEGARKKASRAAALLVGSTVAIGTWIAYALQPLLEAQASGPTEILRLLLAPGAALVFVGFSYWLWVSRFVEGFPMSDLTVSREERLREAAELSEPWKVALVGVSLVGLSALLVWLQPAAWWLGLLGTGLGLGLVYWGSLLKRAARTAG